MNNQIRLYKLNLFSSVKGLLYFISMGSLILLFSCTRVDPPLYNNPYDPENPEFVWPQANITYPVNGQTITTTTLQISWEGAYSSSTFAFQLTGVDANFSTWQTKKQVSYSYLDEGTYTFEVKERISYLEQNTPTQITFQVDAIQQPALIFKPWNSVVNKEEENFLDIWIENISGFKGLSLQMNQTATIQITRVEQNSEQLETGTDGMAFITNSIDEMNQTGTITLDAVLLGESASGFTGNASICRVYYKASENGEINFNETTSKLRDIQNNELAIEEFRGAIISAN